LARWRRPVKSKELAFYGYEIVLNS
jgi:hypothetical protein